MSKLTLLLTTLRGQLAPAVFAQVEQLVADMQSQRVQLNLKLNREQFVKRIEAMQHQAVLCARQGKAEVQLTLSQGQPEVPQPRLVVNSKIGHAKG